MGLRDGLRLVLSSHPLEFSQNLQHLGYLVGGQVKAIDQVEKTDLPTEIVNPGKDLPHLEVVLCTMALLGQK